MGRYVIERNFGAISDDDMLAAPSGRTMSRSERFPEIIWEHSHIVVGDDGEVLTFCIYGAPNEEMIREHAEAFGSHTITESTSCSTTSRRPRSAAARRTCQSH